MATTDTSYLPLYVFCGEFLLCAKLRTADQDGAASSLEELARIVAHIREQWPETRIVVRADSGFCRDWLMAWCEQADGVEFILGLARNKRLTKQISEPLAERKKDVEATGASSRSFHELRYRTKASWSCERRVVAKAEVLVGKTNQRLVMTSLAPEEVDASLLYKGLSCARGDMENRIKEQQLGMFADRTSSQTMRANQLRLWLSSLAYALVNELRAVGLAGTELARAQVWTIRSRLLKVGALVRQSVRRVRISMSSSFPLQEVWAQALRNIAAVREELVF